jgi:hypothetical protein
MMLAGAKGFEDYAPKSSKFLNSRHLWDKDGQLDSRASEP